MKNGKEYPATHSMSTSWFGIDKDGNVAIFEFEDNGPVPYGCEDQGISDLISDEMATRRENGIRDMNYTVQQASTLEKRLTEPTLDKLDWVKIIKINTQATDFFQELCRKNKEVRVGSSEDNYEDSNWPYIIINEERGLYIVNFYNWPDKDKQFLIENKIISGICSDWIETNEKWDKENQKPIFTNDMAGYPYYLYQQPYSPDDLIELTYIPKIPFKATQLSEKVRRNALHLPISFKDTPYLQIAEYFQCGSYQAGEVTWEGIRGFEHQILPTPTGKTIEVRETIIGELRCCRCRKCTLAGHDSFNNFYITQYGLKPTILHLFAPTDEVERSYYPKMYRELFDNRMWLTKMIRLPIIPGIPIKNSSSYLYGEKLKEVIKEQRIDQWFFNCADNFEENVETLNPRVIIATEQADEIVRLRYSTHGSNITIGKQEYHYFVMSSDTTHIEEIKRLSLQPYRGVTPMRIKYLEDNK